MNFDWVKAPKTEEEGKEQFDKLYQVLFQLSNKGKEDSTTVTDLSPLTLTPSTSTSVSLASVSSTSVSSTSVSSTSGMDEFARLRLDLLSNFKTMGVAITPLQTCKGCDRSFYSEAELEKHWESSSACHEWVKRDLTITPESTRPFFTFLEQGISTLLTSDGVSCCIFCKKSIANRKAHDKHLRQSVICNRLAHDTFTKWIENK